MQGLQRKKNLPWPLMTLKHVSNPPEHDKNMDETLRNILLFFILGGGEKSSLKICDLLVLSFTRFSFNLLCMYGRLCLRSKSWMKMPSLKLLKLTCHLFHLLWSSRAPFSSGFWIWICILLSNCSLTMLGYWQHLLEKLPMVLMSMSLFFRF